MIDDNDDNNETFRLLEAAERSLAYGDDNIYHDYNDNYDINDKNFDCQEPLSVDQLVEMKVSPLVKPKPPSATSIPAILKSLQVGNNITITGKWIVIVVS